MLPENNKNAFLYRVIHNSIERMQTRAETLLNPYGYHLSKDAKKRLRWLYVLYDECHTNVTQAANKIGISREWLSKIKSTFERGGRDPRRMKSESRKPHRHGGGRNRISNEEISTKHLTNNNRHYRNRNISTIM